MTLSPATHQRHDPELPASGLSFNSCKMGIRILTLSVAVTSHVEQLLLCLAPSKNSIHVSNVVVCLGAGSLEAEAETKVPAQMQVWAYLGDTAGSVPDPRNKASHVAFSASQCI